MDVATERLENSFCRSLQYLNMDFQRLVFGHFGKQQQLRWKSLPFDVRWTIARKFVIAEHNLAAAT